MTLSELLPRDWSSRSNCSAASLAFFSCHLDDIVDGDGINDVDEEGKVGLGFVAMVVLVKGAVVVVVVCCVLVGVRPKTKQEMN